MTDASAVEAAEQAVLGALLLDNRALARVDGLAVDDFQSERHRILYLGIRDCMDEAGAVDTVTLFTRLQSAAAADRVGGLAYINALAMNTPSAANITQYARVVREHARRRRRAALYTEAASAAAAGDAEAEASIRRHLAAIEEPTTATEATLLVEFADELPRLYSPPDELVEGLLTIGDSSVWYGDSNTGKTFLITDLAAAVSRAVSWMGRRTEGGLVVYLAAESPTSIQRRLQAYQQYHNVAVPNFAIVKSPIDLFTADADTNAIVELVQRIERERGVQCRLVIGDTLSRLSAGANENSGQDMGVVVKRIDHIRMTLTAHFAMIHHSGKVAANGARGWSGIRAAIDTEVEVTDGPQGRCAEITKQRDLSSKGERIGFRLDPVDLGLTKWGTVATSCVVVPADAPVAATGKRMGAVEGAIVEYLRSRGRSAKKAEIVAHFAGQYEKGPVYRAIKALASAGIVQDIVGMVGLSGAAK